MTEAGAPQIRVVFFDIGNVLLRFDGVAVARAMAWAVGRHPVKLLRYVWGSKIGERIERGEITGQELYRAFRRELGYEGDYAAFRKLWCDHFSLERPTAALLKRLTATHRVYLLSNTNHLHYDFIRRNYAFPGQVRGAVLSHRVKARKPEPAIYQAALDLAKARPEECVFIDDLPENVEGARRLGIHGVRYTRIEDLRRDLAALGVPCG